MNLDSAFVEQLKTFPASQATTVMTLVTERLLCRDNGPPDLPRAVSIRRHASRPVRRDNVGELMSFGQVRSLLEYKTRKSLYDLMERDRTFPKPLRLGGASPRSQRWRRDAVFAWLDEQKPARAKRA